MCVCEYIYTFNLSLRLFSASFLTLFDYERWLTKCTSSYINLKCTNFTVRIFTYSP